MKKAMIGLLVCLFALVLGTTALAYNYDFTLDNDSSLGTDDQMLPATSYHFVLSVDGTSIKNISNYFRISDKDYNSGKSFIDSIGLSSNYVYLKTAGNYTVDSDDPEDIDVDVELTATKDYASLGIDKGDTFDLSISYDYGNDLVTIDPDTDADNASTYDGNDESSIFYADGERGYALFDCGDVDALLYFSKNEKVFVSADTETITAVSSKVTSGTATYCRFVGTPTINNTATLRVDNMYNYVYSYSAGSLKQLSSKVSGDYRTWTVSGKLGTYIATTKPLSGTAAAASSSASASASSSASAVTKPQSSAAAAVKPVTPASSKPSAAVSSSSSSAAESSESSESSSEEVISSSEAAESSAAEVMEESSSEAEESDKSGRSLLWIIIPALGAAIVIGVLIAIVASNGKRRD